MAQGNRLRGAESSGFWATCRKQGSFLRWLRKEQHNYPSLYAWSCVAVGDLACAILGLLQLNHAYLSRLTLHDVWLAFRSHRPGEARKKQRRTEALSLG